MTTVKEVKAFFEDLTVMLHESADELARLDGQSGDGDLGASIDAAGAAMAKTASETEGDDVGALLMKIGMACNKAAPSTMGTLVASGIMACAKALKGKTTLENADLAALPRLFADAIIARGKAKVGDKTILDALVPMADAVDSSFKASDDLTAAFAAGAEAAVSGAEATRGMVAQIGRAKWIGERAKDNMDGGAALCSMVARWLCR